MASFRWLSTLALPFDERLRLQGHFRRALRTLAAADLSSMPERLRRKRHLHLKALNAYAARGVFPRNTDFPGRRVPYFVDRSGRECAVAHLLLNDGRDDVAALVRRRENNAYVPAMRTVELVAWAARSGLSLEELALIQPAYCSGCDSDACSIATCVPNDPMSTNNHCVRTPVADGTPCGFGSTEVNACGSCAGGFCDGIDCNDGNRCTKDSCDPTAGCTHDAFKCDDGDPCTADSCDVEKGCVNVETTCDDGSTEATDDGGCALSQSQPGAEASLLMLFLVAAIARKRDRARAARRRAA